MPIGTVDQNGTAWGGLLHGAIMTLLTQSFVLSFATLWRYLIVMPFVVIPGFLIFMTIFIVPVLLPPVIVIFLAAPVLSSTLFTVILTFLAVSISSFNIMVGCRSAFGAMGTFNDLDFGRLARKSMSFSMVQLVASLFLMLTLGGIIAATFLMSDGGTQFMANPTANSGFLVEFLTGHPMAVTVMIVGFALSLGISALLSVPMAGAAISATPNMGNTDAFIGLGSAFLPVLILLILVSIGCSLSGAYEAMFTLLAKLTETVALYLSNAPLIWPAQGEVLLGSAMFMFVIWTSCWFYAASALGWKRFSDDRADALAYNAKVDRFDPEELRALREKRDRDRNGD